jgi:BolA family transcriptional regulator, general stress-responsive regulator
MEALRACLQNLHPVHLHIEDHSAAHAGHAGARSGGHYHVHIVSAAFSGKSTVQRHRLIYEAIGELMNVGVHALSINAQSPEEYHVSHP